jgi:ElaA protein
VAYSRVLPPNELYAQASIGRVAISKEHRGKNLGRELMDYTLELCGELFGKDAQIKIMAQYYLVPFYESLGFEVISNKFWDDEIAHYYMLKRSLES